MVLIVGKASLVCSVASSLLFVWPLHGVLFGWWGVWVLSVGGVCGWVFMSLIGREGVCSENTQPHAFKYRAWWVGGCEAETIMGREASVVKQHTHQTPALTHKALSAYEPFDFYG